MTATIRFATEEDAAAVADLERDSLGSDAWSPALLADGVAGRIPTTLFLVADVGGRLVGYAAVSVVADLAELQRIAVAEPHRRTGVASALVGRVEREALARHADRLLLEVREDNAGALAFYARHGFTELDRRPRYYRDTTTAIVLCREIGRMDA